MLRDKLRFWGERLIESNPWYLAPFSWLYAFVVFLRNQLYDLNLLPITRVPCTVVSVGNVVAGGTGKTPFIHLLASSFPHRKVAILSRGYGSMPDEALLLAKNLPHVKVYVGKDRVRLAQAAALNADLILLDDGFQHRRLYRDFDIVLKRHEKTHYLPWGFLRDSPKRPADAAFTVGKDLELSLKKILDLQGREIPSIRGQKVALFCGIAKPERFKKTVESLGAQIVFEKFFADHEAADLSKLPKDNLLLCTEKDAVKLPPTDLPIYFLQMQMRWLKDPKEWEKLIEKIDQKIDNRSHHER